MPQRATSQQKREYQTELLRLLMDKILQADMFLNEQIPFRLPPGGTFACLINNIVYVTARVVDHLWQNTLVRDSRQIFDFILKVSFTFSPCRSPTPFPKVPQ